MSLSGQCAAAAALVQFAVPCPKMVPSRDGVAMGCPSPVGAQLAPCVGLEGAIPYRVFFLDFAGFDVPQGYNGVGGRPIRDLLVEARPLSESPRLPCFGGVRAGQVLISPWRGTVFVCPKDSVVIQREARHGQGSTTGHILIEWKDNGIDYMASAYGHTTTNIRLLEKLVASITLVQPGS